MLHLSLHFNYSANSNVRGIYIPYLHTIQIEILPDVSMIFIRVSDVPNSNNYMHACIIINARYFNWLQLSRGQCKKRIDKMFENEIPTSLCE